jgi:hypothetical protein
VFCPPNDAHSQNNRDRAEAAWALLGCTIKVSQLLLPQYTCDAPSDKSRWPRTSECRDLEQNNRLKEGNLLARGQADGRA